MNSEIMQQKLAEIAIPLAQRFANDLNKVVETIEQQFPILVQEILRWEFVSSLIPFAIGVIFLLIPITWWLNTLFFVKKNIKKLEQNEMQTEFTILGMGSVFSIFMFLFLGCTLTFSNLGWLKIYLAPRLYLIEYVTNLIKG